MSDAGRTDLARLVVAVVLANTDELRSIAKSLDGSDVAVHEALLQCHLFCGFPRTLAALDVLRESGLRLQPIEGDADPMGDALDARGRGVFDAIYGAGSDDVRGHLERLSPTFARWIAEHAYGRTLSRPGLGADERELLAVAALAATGHDRQLASHARGAVRCGAAPERVRATLDAVADLIDDARLQRAREVVERFARDA